MTFTPSRNYIFAEHYHTRSLQARKVARSVFPIEVYIGPLPPTLGRSLYMARVDPHLIYGAEVALDIVPRHLKLLEDVQLDYLRRFLRLPDRP
jgi:hypothetical protein